MNTFFSAIEQVRLHFLQIASVYDGQQGLQTLQQPVVNGMLPYDKKGIYTMILYPAK